MDIQRVPLKTAFSWIGLLFLICVSSNLSFAQTYNVMNYGAKCNGLITSNPTPDDAAFQAAINAATGTSCTGNSQSHIELPMGQSCTLKNPLTINAACVGIKGNGATMDFTAIQSGTAITVTYSANTQVAVTEAGTWENFHLIGSSSANNTTGLLIQAPVNVFQKIDISGFGTGIKAGDNFYLNQFNSLHIWGNGTGFSCPSGLNNSGENITFNQGAIGDGGAGINNAGCEININQMSFDQLSTSAYIGTGGQFRCTNCHIEYNTPITTPIFDLAGCNAWTSIDIEGGSIQSSASSPNMLALVRNNPQTTCGGSGSWAYLSRVFLAGISPSAQCAAGTGQYCVVGSNSGQVRMDLSTTGDGGGSFGNAHIP